MQVFTDPKSGMKFAIHEGEEWEHPTLGEFELDLGRWLGDGDGFEISFEAIDDEDPPTEDHVLMMLRTLERLDSLLTGVHHLLWEDLHGRGQQTGMWWRGEFATAFPEQPPADASALGALMQLRRVALRLDAGHAGEDLVELQFDAPFEEEHGVGTLTDGLAILGVGYQHSAMRFQPQGD